MDFNTVNTTYDLRCCPLELSIIYLLRCTHNQFPNGAKMLRYIRRQFAVLRLLLDARANVCQLDGNMKKFLQLIRNRLNTNYTQCPQDILAFCNQILDAIESDFHTPRKLIEMCRSRVRHELNIRDLCVHDIRDDISRIVENYLLYSDLPHPDEYLVFKYTGD